MEQGNNTPERIHSPHQWAEKLVESSKIAPEEEQSLAPQEEALDSESDAEYLEAEDNNEEDPTSIEDQEDGDGIELEADAEQSEETEPSEDVSTDSSIVADGVYIVDGEEFDGQTLINGIAATKNFNEEKHRLRVEAREELEVQRGELQKVQDEYAAGLQFMLGVNQQAQQKFTNVNWIELQQKDPAQYQKLQAEQGQLLAAQQQIEGQFGQFLNQVKANQAAESRKQAEMSVSVLRDTFGGEEGWRNRYGQLRSVADKFGFKNQEFNTITDHRFMMMLDKVDSLQSELAEIKSTASKKKANPVKQKLNRRNSQRVNTTQKRKMADANEQFLKTRKPKDAAAMLMQASEAGSKGR